MIQLKRVYEKPGREDGLRVLVDRLWPRGLTKERAAVDLWLKDVAPSTELRKWFGHDPARWKEFQTRYRKELRDKKDALKVLKQKSEEQTVTLVYAARDEEHNEALVLKRILEGKKTKDESKAKKRRMNPTVPDASSFLRVGHAHSTQDSSKGEDNTATFDTEEQRRKVGKAAESHRTVYPKAKIADSGHRVRIRMTAADNSMAEHRTAIERQWSAQVRPALELEATGAPNSSADWLGKPESRSAQFGSCRTLPSRSSLERPSEARA